MKSVSGFTLLELLIGLSLLGFVMALLFGGFRLATQTRETVETHVQHTAVETTSHAFIRRILGSVQPVRLKRLRGQPLAFVGQQHLMILVAPLTEQTGLRTIELSIQPQQGTSHRRLTLRHGAPPHDTSQILDPLSNTTYRSLLASLQDASFSYYGPANRGAVAQWHDTWDNTEQLPSLVKLQISPSADESREIVIDTVIDTDPNTQVRIMAGPVGLVK